MDRKYLIVLLLLVVIILLGFIAYGIFFGSTGNNNGIPTPTPDITEDPTPSVTPTNPDGGIRRIFSTKGEEIQILTPDNFENLQSPLVVEGEVHGSWYFEASFPISLENENGEIIHQVPAQATEDWMQDDWVSFKTTLNFNVTEPTKAKLILRNDNPSGLPENQDEAVIDVTLLPMDSNAQTIPVKVFLKNNNLDPNAEDCEKSYEVSRQIPQTTSVARAALLQLLSGPTEDEESQGYFSVIPQGTKLIDVQINNGVITANFSKELDENIGGSCLVSGISGQITQTLLQFPSVQEVKICREGDCETVLQP